MSTFHIGVKIANLVKNREPPAFQLDYHQLMPNLHEADRAFVGRGEGQAAGAIK
jgi:hypothetical protein